jgi:hypothetical protein
MRDSVGMACGSIVGARVGVSSRLGRGHGPAEARGSGRRGRSLFAREGRRATRGQRLARSDRGWLVQVMNSSALYISPRVMNQRFVTWTQWCDRPTQSTITRPHPLRAPRGPALTIELRPRTDPRPQGIKPRALVRAASIPNREPARL